MNKRLKITLLTLVSLFVSFTAFANDTTKTAPKPNPYELEIYGFVRNDFTFDSRKTLASVGELFNFIPMDNSFNAAYLNIRGRTICLELAWDSRDGKDIVEHIISLRSITSGESTG